jgi:hypothetical protein
MTGKVVSRFFCAVEFEQFKQDGKSCNCQWLSVLLDTNGYKPNKDADKNYKTRPCGD